MVVTFAPSACSRQHRAGLHRVPSTCTTQAPHWLVSQPTWVPVRPQLLAQELTSSVRASTSAVLALPFTVSVTCGIPHLPQKNVQPRGRRAAHRAERSPRPRLPSSAAAHPADQPRGSVRDAAGAPVRRPGVSAGRSGGAGIKPLPPTGRQHQQPEHQRAERPEYPDRPERHGAEHPRARPRPPGPGRSRRGRPRRRCRGRPAASTSLEPSRRPVSPRGRSGRAAPAPPASPAQPSHAAHPWGEPIRASSASPLATASGFCAVGRSCRWQAARWPARVGAQRRLLRPAAVEGVGAAGVEAAALGRVDRARHVALQDDALARRAGLGTGTADSSACV